MTASGSAKAFECQGLLHHIDELEGDLSGYRDQLAIKTDELATLRALPKEDPILVQKIHDLESIKATLQNQVDTANQETSNAKDDLASSREVSLRAQKQTQELQSKLIDFQASLQTLREDKNNYLSSHKSDVDKARQEIAKSINASKAEAQLKHDCLAKNLEQRRSEAEKELALFQEKLQKSQEESAGYLDNSKILQEELSTCKKQLTQQTVYIKHVDQCNPSRDEFDSHERNIQQAVRGMAEIKAQFDVAQSEISKKLDRFVGHQQQAEMLIRRVDSLEQEILAIQEQKSEIQKAYNNFRDNVSRYLRRSDIFGEKSADEFLAAMQSLSPAKMGPPAVPIPIFVTNRPSSVTSNLTQSHASSGEDKMFPSGFPGSPKEALRRNEQMQGPSTQHTTNLIRGNDIIHHINLRGKSRVVTGIAIPTVTEESSIHFHSRSSYQAKPNPLRVANRKSSGVLQSAQIEKSSESIQRVGTADSVLDHVPSKTLLSSQTPTNMIESSAKVPLSHSVHSLGNSEQLQPSVSNVASRRTEGLPYILTDISFTSAPVLASSSPLSELSMLDEIGYNDEEVGTAHVQSREMDRRPLMNKEIGGKRPPMQTFAANTAVGVVHFKTPPSSRHQFSEEDDLSGINTVERLRLQVPSLSEESARRRESKPLKSALRIIDKKQMTTSTNDTQSDIYQIPGSAPTATITLQKQFSRPITNKKQQAQRRKGNIGSSYNRIVSGSKPDYINQSSGALSAAHHKSDTNLIANDSEKSPLMKAPARLARKRSASTSEATSQPNKPFKQQRIVLPSQAQKPSRMVIPDSQEAAKYSY